MIVTNGRIIKILHQDILIFLIQVLPAQVIIDPESSNYIQLEIFIIFRISGFCDQFLGSIIYHIHDIHLESVTVQGVTATTVNHGTL